MQCADSMHNQVLVVNRVTDDLIVFLNGNADGSCQTIGCVIVLRAECGGFEFQNSGTHKDAPLCIAISFLAVQNGFVPIFILYHNYRL